MKVAADLHHAAVSERCRLLFLFVKARGTAVVSSRADLFVASSTLRRSFTQHQLLI
jgi:hypothetical protein